MHYYKVYTIFHSKGFDCPIVNECFLNLSPKDIFLSFFLIEGFSDVRLSTSPDRICSANICRNM